MTYREDDTYRTKEEIEIDYLDAKIRELESLLKNALKELHKRKLIHTLREDTQEWWNQQPKKK